MKCILLAMISFWLHLSTKAQDLQKVQLAAGELKSGIIKKYAYSCSGSYCEVQLLLFKNGEFDYRLSRFNADLFSKGKWVEKNGVLTITSYITSEMLPARLEYSDDTSSLINGFKVGVVRNKKNELMLDGMVNINNDSVQCVPMGGFCNGTYRCIDSIKIIFENGISSRWMRVEKRSYGQIIPVVDVDFPIASYLVFEKRKYKILRSSLKPLD